jgi:hypothetical protein
VHKTKKKKLSGSKRPSGKQLIPRSKTVIYLVKKLPALKEHFIFNVSTYFQPGTTGEWVSLHLQSPPLYLRGNSHKQVRSAPVQFWAHLHQVPNLVTILIEHLGSLWGFHNIHEAQT